MSFPALEAQPSVASYLAGALENDRLPHALCFLGPAGSLQKEAAQEIAKALFCANKRGAAGCGECVACRQAASWQHPDLKCFEAEEDSRTIKIEQVRAMISEAHLKPFQAPRKIFFIDRAERLNEVSQNALLKTLEEPPANTYFILNCHASEKMLPTVRSRAHTLHFRPLGDLTESSDETSRLRAQLVARVMKGASAVTPDLGGLTREQLATLLEASIRDVRDTLMIRVGCDTLIEEAPDILDKRRYAEAHAARSLIDALELLSTTKEQLEQSANAKLSLSALWDRV